MLAARAALAPASASAARRCSGLPGPAGGHHRDLHRVDHGAGHLQVVAVLVPSASMLVSTISPAPSRSTSRAQATASSPVGTRPPLMWTSQTSRPSRIDPLGVDVDHDALAAELARGPANQIGVAHGGRVDRDLVGPGLQESPDVVQAADSRRRRSAA